MVDQGDLGGALGVLAGMIGAALSWAAGLGVVTVLFSVGIGALLTYLVQTKTQKMAWKRDAALRKVDDIYGPLYYQLNKLSQAITQDSNLYYYPATEPGQPNWESIRTGYKYYLVDPPLRKELDDFFGLLEQFSKNNAQRSWIVEGMLLPRLREAFGREVQAASYQVSAIQSNGMPVTVPGETLDRPILAEQYPLEFTRRQYPGFADYFLELSLQRAGTMQPIFTRQKPDLNALEKFKGVIRTTIEEVKSEPTILLVARQKKSLMAQAGSLKEKLRVKTEEP